MIEKYKKEIIEIIKKYIPNVKIYIFGSRARKTQKEGSDLDIALETQEKIDLNTLLTIKDEILEKTTFPLFIDIVDMHSIPDDLKEEIIREGVLWNDL